MCGCGGYYAPDDRPQGEREPGIQTVKRLLKRPQSEMRSQRETDYPMKHVIRGNRHLTAANAICAHRRVGVTIQASPTPSLVSETHAHPLSQNAAVTAALVSRIPHMTSLCHVDFPSSYATRTLSPAATLAPPALYHKQLQTTPSTSVHRSPSATRP